MNKRLEALREQFSNNSMNGLYDKPSLEFTQQQNDGTTEKSRQAMTKGRDTEDKTTAMTDNYSYDDDDNMNDNLETDTFQFSSFAEYCETATPPEYLIHGEVLARGLHMTIGEPSSGKTFYVLDKCASIACEEITTWHGMPIKHGEVLYLCGEASGGLKLRCKAWAIKRGINPRNVKMRICDTVFSLEDNEDKIIDSIRRNAIKPVYIVVDTLRAFMGGDENQSLDAEKLLNVCRSLINAFGCAVELVHHVGVGQETKGRARGSSAFRGAMDIEVIVHDKETTDNGIRCRITQKKNKDGRERKDFVFSMEEITIDGLFDEYGNPCTSLVAELDTERTDRVKHEAKTEKTIKRSKPYKRGVKAFENASLEHGRIVIEGSESFIEVTEKQWREAVAELQEVKELSAPQNEFAKIIAELVDGTADIGTTPPFTTREEAGTIYYRLPRNTDVDKNIDAWRKALFKKLMEYEK